jgi:hypothetical protein
LITSAPPFAHPFFLPRRLHFSVWGVLIVLALGLVVVSGSLAGRNFWARWPESENFPRSNYAERIYHDNFFRTRANTWSNLAYVAVGLYGLAFAWHDRRRCDHAAEGGYLVRTPPLSFLFGLACCWLGAGSGLFHASLTRFGQRLDVASMYGGLLVFIAIGLGRWLPAVKFAAGRPPLPTWPVFGGLAVVASALLYRFKWSMSAVVVLTTLILAVATLSLLDHFHPARKMSARWAVSAVLALAAAVACRQLDVAGRFTGPDAWLQGHALWHVLTAVCIGCTYLYYRSEVGRDPHPALAKT